MKKIIIFAVTILFCSVVFAQTTNSSGNNKTTVRITKVIFDDEEETVTPAKGSLSYNLFFPNLRNNDGNSDAHGYKASYTGSKTRKNKICYVTFSDGVSKRYDCYYNPEWRTVLKNELVEKTGSSYKPLHKQ